MKKPSKTKISIENQSLLKKFQLAAFFMFVVPLLLSFSLIEPFLFGKNQGTSILSYSPWIFFMMIISGILGYFLIRRAANFIIELTQKAKSITREMASQESEEVQGDELKDLAQAFNRITDDLEKKIKELEYSRNLTRELFQQIGQTITSSQKLDSLLRLIVQSLRKVLRAEAGFVAVYDTGEEHLFLKAYSGPQKDLIEDMELSDHKGVIGFVIQNRKPMVIQKAGQSADPTASPDTEKIKYRSILCVPIILKNKIKGVIGVSDLIDREKIDAEDLFLIENVTGQIATAIENFELNKDIEETYYQTLLTLARVVEAKDAYSAGHLERVSRYVGKMADQLKLDEETKKILTGGAILHDLGKVGIEDQILKKEDRFSAREFEIMKQHAIIGENILKPLLSMSKLSQLVRHHHESYDGSGYPDGLIGEEIPFASRILAIADIYDALTTDRPYRKALSREEAITILTSYKGNKLDPLLTEIFIQTI